jgi:hypothetical protein
MSNRRITGVALLDYEIAQERAATLGRLGRRLEEALAALRAHDAARQEPATASDRSARRQLVLEAGEALWYFVIQRELTGFHDSAAVMRDYRVPRDVQACMGVRPNPLPACSARHPPPQAGEG